MNSLMPCRTQDDRPSMETEIIDPLTLLQGLALLTAIPVVGMALWLDYFWRYVEEVKNEEPTEYDPATEAQKVRLASLMGLILQLVLFLGAGQTRKLYPLSTTALFVLATFLHFWMQAKAERRLLPPKKPSEAPSAQLGWALRAFLWSALGGATYIGFLLITIQISFSIIHHFNIPAPWNAGVMLWGLLAGIFAGLGAGFAFGPFQIRRMFPTSTLTDEKIRGPIEKSFQENGLPIPGLWNVDLEGLQSHNILLAGFRSGRGFFRPALFISTALLSTLTPEELRAAILHEVSHLKLAHLKNRFIFTCGLILAASLLSGILVFASHLLFPSTGIASLVGFAVLLGTFFSTFKMIEKQGRLQEIEADIHTIQLGAQIEDLEGALQKLDQLNGVGTHPTPQERIQIVRAYFSQNSAPQTPPSQEKTAA